MLLGGARGGCRRGVDTAGKQTGARNVGGLRRSSGPLLSRCPRHPDHSSVARFGAGGPVRPPSTVGKPTRQGGHRRFDIGARPRSWPHHPASVPATVPQRPVSALSVARANSEGGVKVFLPISRDPHTIALGRGNDPTQPIRQEPRGKTSDCHLAQPDSGEGIGVATVVQPRRLAPASWPVRMFPTHSTLPRVPRTANRATCSLEARATAISTYRKH